MSNLDFFKGKRVFLTGQTGFKGAWLSHLLIRAGAIVTGYGLKPNTNPSLYALLGLEKKMNSVIGDVRDFEGLQQVFEEAAPEIVLHLAAQPIVLESYKAPRYTFETNVMGTVNLLECIRLSNSVRSVVNVTTDKVYENKEWLWGYRENEPLDGFDPYSNSKSCSELVTHSYRSAFFTQQGMAVSTARAGNVIGGGDFAADRIIPDCVRAAMQGESIIVRNPYSTRPYQHVLEPLDAYLTIARKQWEDPSLADWYNVGPDDRDCVATGALATLFCEAWGDGLKWINRADKNAPHEANYLKLDCSRIKGKLAWKPQWGIKEAIEKTVEWSRCYMNGEDLISVTERQIDGFYSRQ